MKAASALLYACLVILLAGCDTPQKSASHPTANPTVPTVAPPSGPIAPKAGVVAVDETLAYKQLPEIELAVESTLVASPAHPTAYLATDPIPAGRRVRVVGTDRNAAWLLVLHGNTLGWIPAFYSRTGIGTLKPAVVVDPLSDTCTRYLDALTVPERAWVSKTSDPILVQGIIYRPQPGEQSEDASVAIEIEGVGQVSVSEINRTLLPASGEVLVFISTIEDLQKGNRIRFQLTGIDNEPMAFQAAFFSNACPGDTTQIATATQVVQPRGGGSPATQPPRQSGSAPVSFPTSTPIIVRSGPASGIVTAITLNIRSGPGVEYHPPIGTLKAGERVSIIGYNTASDGSTWWQIRLSSGKSGWVHSRYVNESGCVDCVPIVAAPPLPTVVDPHFRADRLSIRPGECTTLRWDVEGIKEVYLDGRGQIGHDFQQVCPAQTQTFTLTVVQRDGQRVPHTLTIQVSGPPVSVSHFVIQYRGCIGGVSKGIGPVKGQVFRRNGQIVVGAVIDILIDGQSGIVPPGRTNQDGWYEWYLTPGQRVRFVSLVVDGRPVSFTPANFEVVSTSGCYQHVNFRER